MMQVIGAAKQVHLSRDLFRADTSNLVILDNFLNGSQVAALNDLSVLINRQLLAQ